MPDSSVQSVQRVLRLDGRSSLVALRPRGAGWIRPRSRTRFDSEQVRILRDAGVAEVVLRRGFRRVALPLRWAASHLAP